ncbi:hypothetical protein ACFQUX_16750 [Pantoea stewartii]
MVTQRLNAYASFIERCRINDTPTASFVCPYCGSTLWTLAAPPGEVWTSLCSCPFCDGMFGKVVKGLRVKVAVVNDSGGKQNALENIN